MLREVLARFGIEFDGQGLLAARGGLVALATAAAAAAAAIGVGLVVALRDLTVEMAEFGDEVAKSARTLGISADQLSAWRFAAERAGVPAQALTNGLRRLQRNIVDASEGMETAQRAFRDVGVETRDASGNFREIEDILPDIADGFAALESDTQRSARAQQLFGRSGALLLPFFAQGSEGLAEMQRRFDELTGGGFGEFFELSEAAQDSMADWELASTAVKATLATELLPILTATVTTVSDLVGWFNSATRDTRPFRAILLGLGIAIGSVAAAVTLVLLPALAPLLLIFGAWAAAIAIVVLAVDDLLTLFEGGDSVIGRFLDAMFGVGTAAEVAEAARLAWADFVRWVEAEAIPVVMAIGRTFVGLWPLMRVGLRAIGRFIAAPFRFLAALPGLVRSAFESIVSLFDAISERVSSAVASWMSGLDRLRGGLATVGEFFGVDVPGAAPAASPGAVVRPEGSKTTNVDQTVDVTINGSELSAEELTRSVRDALSEANERALRVASRALTTVAG